jgi:hypothetical protein
LTALVFCISTILVFGLVNYVGMKLDMKLHSMEE